MGAKGASYRRGTGSGLRCRGFFVRFLLNAGAEFTDRASRRFCSGEAARLGGSSQLRGAENDRHGLVTLEGHHVPSRLFGEECTHKLVVEGMARLEALVRT
jgi:hypothetical protein